MFCYVLGKILYVGRSQKKEERRAEIHNQMLQKTQERVQYNQENNLYIKNIDLSVTDNELREHFSEFGTIISSKVTAPSDLCQRHLGLTFFIFFRL